MFRLSTGLLLFLLPAVHFPAALRAGRTIVLPIVEDDPNDGAGFLGGRLRTRSRHVDRLTAALSRDLIPAKP